MASIKIGFITDPHDDTTTPSPGQVFGDSPGWRIPGVDYSAVSIPAFVSTCNSNSVDLAIHGGDIVNGPVSSVAGNDTDRHANFAQYVGRMGTLSADIIHAFGHWDVGVDNVTGSDYDDLVDNAKGVGSLQPAGIANPWWPSAATDLTPVSYTFEKNGFRVVVLTGMTGLVGGGTAGEYTGPTVATQQQWLDDVALNTSLPIIVVCHQPIKSQLTVGAGLISGDTDIVASLESLTIKPVVLQGHVHKLDSFFVENGISYIDFHGDVWGEESTDTDRSSHAVVTVTNNSQTMSSVVVEGFGLQSSSSFDASLVAHWKLNETSGTSIADSAGGNTGTSANPVTSVNGPIDQKAIRFNGTTDIISALDTIIIDYPLTLATWINTTDTSKQAALSISSSGTANKHHSVGTNIGGVGMYQLKNDGIGSETLVGTTVIADEEWHHVVGVSAAHNDHKLYIDGTLVAVNTDTRTIDNTRNQWSVGARINDATPLEFFDGDIDDARIYSTALTASQVQSLWSDGAALGYRGRYDFVRSGRPLDRTRGKF
jgi:hypothetical protein